MGGISLFLKVSRYVTFRVCFHAKNENCSLHLISLYCLCNYDVKFNLRVFSFFTTSHFVLLSQHYSALFPTIHTLLRVPSLITRLNHKTELNRSWSLSADKRIICEIILYVWLCLGQRSERNTRHQI